MKILRNALLASFLILVWAIVFSTAAIPSALAQDDVSAPPPPPPSAQVSPETVPDQSQTYDKPDAGQPAVAPEQQQDQSQVEPQVQTQAQPQDQPSDQRAYDKPDAGQPMEIPDESANGTATEPANEMGNGQSDESDRNDPPGRVARLQYTTGSVSIQPHGTDQWVEGSVNRPLTIADNVWADKNSRAELNVGTGLIRIGSETSLTLTNVSDNSVQLSLHQGAMNLHVRHLYNGEVYEVDTPNQAFTILKTGDYRFDVDPSADTTLVTVWRGEGESTGQGPSVRIKEHQQARFTTGDTLAHEIHGAPRPDGFDDWCQVRDRREDNSVSARYVSPDVIGSEDLDANGTWRDTPEYGHVWVPNQVDPGWAPYTDGQWIYESPWGWTWDDYEPWGFAPFHYGRWVSFGGYWGWAPGPYYGGWGRGFYAPALVSWFGGPGWGVGFGFGFGGGYGWCPLGFGEPFRPWYHAGWGYFRGVNIYNTRINNINGFHNGFRNGFRNGFGAGFHYANLNARGGFTAVSRGTLERGLPVRQNAVRVNAGAVRSAPALGRPGVNPTMQSRLGRNAGRPAAAAPARSMSRSTVSRMTPPAASRSNSFGSPRAGMNQATGRGSVARPAANFGRSNTGISSNNATGPNNSFSRSPVSGNSMSSGRNVPRPPSAGGATGSQSARTAVNQGPSNHSFGNPSRPNTSFGRSVPRPPAGWTPSQNSSNNRGMASQQQSLSRQSSSRQSSPRGSVNNGASSGAYSGGSRNSVPRPTGRVLPAPRSYSSGGNSGYSARSYSGNSARYSSGSQYGRSSYGGSSRYSGSQYSGRSYGGSSYGGGSRGAASSGGGRSYSSSRGSSGGGGSRGSSGGGSRGSSHGGHR